MESKKSSSSSFKLLLFSLSSLVLAAWTFLGSGVILIKSLCSIDDIRLFFMSASLEVLTHYASRISHNLKCSMNQICIHFNFIRGKFFLSAVSASFVGDSVGEGGCWQLF